MFRLTIKNLFTKPLSLFLSHLEPLLVAEVLWDLEGENEDEFSLKAGAIIQVTERVSIASYLINFQNMQKNLAILLTVLL